MFYLFTGEIFLKKQPEENYLQVAGGKIYSIRL